VPGLRVLIDATPIPPQRGGVGRYVEEVVRALSKLPLDIVIVCQPHDVKLFRSRGVSRVISTPRWVSGTVSRLLWEQIGLPRLAKAVHAGVIHSVHYTSPLFTRLPRVVTIHDLTFFSHPQFHSRVKRWFFRFWLRLSTGRNRTIIAVSEATATAYRKQFPRAHCSVIVAPLAGDPHKFHVPTDAERAAFMTHIEAPPPTWIAFLGTLEPRKNVPELITGYIDAMATIPPAERPSLLLAGSTGWDTNISAAVQQAISHGHDVRLLGYLPVEELSAFLGNAELVIYPSFGEGFGLPVLEAMATGAAVVTTRCLSLPEVGGDAVFYTEPNHESISTAIRELLGNKPAREAARKRAIIRAAQFSWELTAERHRDAYIYATREAS
jgi:glycosyltransferase involved in cell wall biosynthesis